MTADKMKRKTYEKELKKLQTELCYLQEWLKTTGERAIVVLEGRDAAGKGGTIKAMGPAVRKRGTRFTHSSRNRRSSIRARCDPMQRCAPDPNTRCPLSSRSKSTRSGSLIC